MVTSLPASARSAGFWSAVASAFFSLAYVIAQLAEWMGWLGSAGGPESTSTPLGLALLLTPSLFLGISFLVLNVSVHQLAATAQKIWSQSAVAFATAYAVLICLVYYVQLALVVPRMAAGRMEGIELLHFVPFDSFLYAVDLLGYSFMSIATLFAARVFTGAGEERVARWFLTANGLLLPFLALQMYYPDLLWIAALWAVSFPAATISLAIIFYRVRVTPPGGTVPIDS